MNTVSIALILIGGSMENMENGTSKFFTEQCNYDRYYDQKLWLVPGAAYTLTVAIFVAVGQCCDPYVKMLLSFVNLCIFSGFLIQFLRDRVIQLEIRYTLEGFDTYAPEGSPDLKRQIKLSFNQSLKNRELEHTDDRMFIKWIRKKGLATSYAFCAMLVTLIADVILIVFCTADALHCMYPAK